MAELTRDQFRALAASRLPDNRGGEISEADLREVMGDLTDSVAWKGEAAGHAFLRTAATTIDLGVFVGSAVIASDAATAVTLTVPADADAALPVGSTFLIIQEGAGHVWFEPGPGATLALRDSWEEAATDGPGAAVAAVKTGPDAWRLTGQLVVKPEAGALEMRAHAGGPALVDATWGRQLVEVGAAATLTLPAHLDTPLPVGFHFWIAQASAGPVAIEAEPGVSIGVLAGRTTTLAGLHAMVSVVKIGADLWRVSGDLAAA